jgi:phosphatidylserine/phosphatidylglycerophosphate/cardiolipin synthase-like enzyme
MHDKYMIIDGRLLVTGSYNWSASAESYNFENAIFIQGSSIIQSYEADFDKIWGK